MYVLAIDPGTTLGFATYDGHKYLSGVVKLSRAAERGIARDMWRCRRFADFLMPFVHVTQLAIEGSAGHRFRQAAKVAGQLEGIALAWAVRLGVPVVRVAPAELKKWATGNGNADKAAMIGAATRLTGVVTMSTDEADALCICAWPVEKGASHDCATLR